MSGIGNYFHGEEGVVRERRWLFTDESISDVLLLDGDPHRNYVCDYTIPFTSSNHFIVLS